MNIYKIYKSRTDLKMFLEIILSLVTVAFFASFALRPTAFTITQLLQDISAKEDTIAKMDRKIQDLSTAQNSFEQAGARLGVLSQALPDTPSPEVFARQMEGAAAKNGVSLNSLAIDNITLIGEASQAISVEQAGITAFPINTGEIPIAINVSGSYPNLINFWGDLENLRRPIKIDQAVIGVAETEGGKTLTFSVTGRIPFFSREPEKKEEEGAP
ncbi:type 4a pilus biogenesis protein PilO [Candidatus Woesebacteria bacterium]|nr:type 4a pilus biogenesis protein PilO [Candidatus Woesebacteria bacterium]